MAQSGPDAALSMIPCLIVRDVAAAADFYVAAFAAEVEAGTQAAPDRATGIRLALGACRLLLVEADRAGLRLGPESYGGAPVRFTLVARDAAALRARALAQGAVALPAGGWLRDPFLHLWRIVDDAKGRAPPADPPP